MDSNNAQASQQYEQVVQQCNDCLVLLRQLRNGAIRLHNHLFHSRPQSTSNEMWDMYFRQFEQLDKEFRDCFDNLENCAEGLPNQLPQIDPLNRLQAVLQDEQLGVQGMETVESMIDCENWNEGNFVGSASRKAVLANIFSLFFSLANIHVSRRVSPTSATSAIKYCASSFVMFPLVYWDVSTCAI
ncbi:hypothetical protein KIN20_035457 [Parelaphostrongylus tenuis]|uniref:Uncharacterized protein n=1 Tax=Parelaphostrongylus tenuis TaxID=148309 RepID=A0AAD5RBT8_PARTN|nr:hypothetical protein KIN20_035457 [Parelaphostrongylus tenuis]